MNFKKIIALICACAVLASGVNAYTPFLDEDLEEQEQQQENSSASEDEAQADEKTDVNESNSSNKEQQTQSDKDNNTSKPSTQGVYKPQNSYYYSLFKQILDVYVRDHLYEFTHEDVMYKLFEDFLTDNPMYFKYMTNYLLGTMDDYSSYHEADDGFLNGDYASLGFGILVATDENGNAIVKKVYEGSNAQKAGIMAGDKFVSVMGFKVDDLPIDAVTTIIANISHFIAEDQMPNDQEDVVYSFEFERNGEIIPVSLTKGIMTVGSIESYVEVDNSEEIGVITLTTFLEKDLDKKFIQTIDDFHSRGIKNLTIDLRDNHGGNLDYALSMVECFIPNGEIIGYYNDKHLDEPRAIYSTTDHYSFDSIVILVNDQSISAAELFARILHVKGLAKLVGTNTFGKCVGQSTYTFSNGDYITITSFEILDQNLESYNGIGLKPDIEIDITEMYYSLPSLMWFNHENYKEIQEGQYSDPAKALEDRLVIAGLMFEQDSDGIFDDTTKRAVYALQLYLGIEPSGILNDETVTGITKLINAYKTYTYYEDSPYEVSLFVHRSFSQGKRRAAEILKVAEKEKEKIEERDRAIEEALDANDKEKEQQESTNPDGEETKTSENENEVEKEESPTQN